jgi:hypothetical protein
VFLDFVLRFARACLVFQDSSNGASILDLPLAPATERPWLPGPFSLERTGIEPVTSGLQNQRKPGDQAIIRSQAGDRS